jgi:hypothetical protein
VSTLTYVYCLVLSTRRPAIAPHLKAIGVPGARGTRALGAGDGLWLIVADVPQQEYDEAALARGMPNLDWVGQRAIAHEAMIERFLSARAVLPMQLFTLFTSDERALEHVNRQRQEILAIVGRLERKLEWGIRVTFDEQAVRAGVETEHGSRGRQANSSGAAYLARKRDLLDVHRGRLRAARTAADALFTALTREAADAHRRTATEEASSGSRLLLDAALLVPTARSGAFRAAVRRETKAIGASGVVVTVTGPWPPYNFIAAPSRPPAASRQAPRAALRQPRAAAARRPRSTPARQARGKASR